MVGELVEVIGAWKLYRWGSARVPDVRFRGYPL
jgi:hypothetical protein